MDAQAVSDDHQGSVLSHAVAETVHKSVLARCGAQAGVDEGLVTNPTSCDWRPEMVACSADKSGPGCLTARQVDAIRRLMSPAVNSKGPSSEIQPQFSPDGKWVAYASDESGRSEVYLQPYPVDGRRLLISTDGGLQPAWRNDGRELFFLSLTGTLNAVGINSALHTLKTGAPQHLFQFDIAGFSPIASNLYSAAPDGERFLIVERPPRGRDALVEPLTTVLNWTAELQRPR